MLQRVEAHDDCQDIQGQERPDERVDAYGGGIWCGSGFRHAGYLFSLAITPERGEEEEEKAEEEGDRSEKTQRGLAAQRP